MNKNKMNYDLHLNHRRSIRLKGYDYSQSGAYFITICVKDRAHLFGKISDGEMVLNVMGQIANDEWLKTSELRKNVQLDVFVIMPNHIHGIIMFHGRGELHSPFNNQRMIIPDELHSPFNNQRMIIPDELHSPVSIKGECNSPLRGPSDNIGAIVGGYKSSVTKQLNLLNIGCAVWQRNYYEHVIQNDQSYQTISEYIINNPAKWADDKFYTK